MKAKLNLRELKIKSISRSMADLLVAVEAIVVEVEAAVVAVPLDVVATLESLMVATGERHRNVLRDDN